jgi:hypothetical protein
VEKHHEFTRQDPTLDSSHPVTNEENQEAKDPVPAATIPAARPTFRKAIRVALTGWWGSGPASAQKKSSDDLALDRTAMAATRTLMAADRTLMAWVRGGPVC